jgi:ABC-2 type transport system ATP-binding protein
LHDSEPVITPSSLQADAVHVNRSGRAVLRGVSFSVDRGEIYALLGGNGAGKSTTLLTFLGLLRTEKGNVRVNGREVGDDPVAARRAMAYLPESAALYDHLDARENLEYLLGIAGSQATAREIATALDEMGLPPSAHSRALAEYSKGMRQKVALALATLRNSEILLLDEPTSGLDPSAIDEFHSLVRRLAGSGKSVLMVTHDLHGACHSADRVGLLRDGRLTHEFRAYPEARINPAMVHQAFTASCPP